jgi:hypothetical protein
MSASGAGGWRLVTPGVEILEFGEQRLHDLAHPVD